MLAVDRRELSTYSTHPMPFYPVMERLRPTRAMLPMPSAEELLKPVQTIRDTLTHAVSCFEERKRVPSMVFNQMYARGEHIEHSPILNPLPRIIDHLVHNVAHANQRKVFIERAGWTRLRSPHCALAGWLAQEVYVNLVLTGALMPDEHACVKIEETTTVHKREEDQSIESVRVWSIICDFYMKGL